MDNYWYSAVFANYLFHPYHVIPAAEFITAFVELTDFVKPEMFMELFAVSVKIFIFYNRVSDAGIEIYKSPRLQFQLQCIIEAFAVSFPM